MANQPAFGPVVPEVLPPAYHAASQGIRHSAKTGVADAFGDLAKIGGATITAVDSAIQEGIRKDATQGFDEISASFGVEDATTMAEVIEPTPHAIRNGERRLKGLQAQFEAGVTTERHYYATLNTMVRQLRSKYPGYREQIDNIVGDVTGVRPANQLQAALFAEAEASKTNQTKEEKRVQALADDGNLPPDFYSRQGTSQAYSMAEVEAYAGNRNYIKAETTAQRAALGLRADTGDANEEDAVQVFSAEANKFIYANLKDASSAIGKNFANINSMIAQASESAGKGSFNSPEEKAQISAGLNELVRTTKAALYADATNPALPFSGLITDKKKLDDTIEIAMSPIYNLVEAFGGENANLSLLKSTAAQIEASNDATTADLMSKVDGAKQVMAINKIMGSEMGALYLNADGGKRLNAFVKSMQDYQTSKAQTEEGFNVLQSLTEIDLLKHKDKDAIKKAVLQHWPYLIEQAAKGNLSPEVYQKNIKFMFAPQTLELMSTLDPADRTEYLKLVTSPTVTRQMITLKNEGDTESWEMYKDWTTTAFQAIFRDEVQELQQYQIDNRRMDVQYDNKSNQFVMVPNAEYKDRTMMKKDIGRELRDLNTMLQVIAPIVQEEGMETGEQIASLLQGMGYDKDVEQTGTLGDQLWEAVTSVTERAVKNATGQDRKPFWETGPVNKKYRTPSERNQTKVKVLEETNVNPQ